MKIKFRCGLCNKLQHNKTLTFFELNKIYDVGTCFSCFKTVNHFLILKEFANEKIKTKKRKKNKDSTKNRRVSK